MQKKPRSWQRMLSGRRLDLLNPSPLDIEIEDIARGISRVARWNGQTSGEYPLSVAQHSVIVAEFLKHNNKNIEIKWQLAALLHDAAEYIISDMITPLKLFLGEEYIHLEEKIQSAINIRFSLPGVIPKKVNKLIKICDKQTAFIEAIQLAGFTLKDAKKTLKMPKFIPDYNIIPISSNKAEKLFLKKFEELY
jgi:5'-deoxynucleotidase YfbR-like HD superfamily hydrolase